MRKGSANLIEGAGLRDFFFNCVQYERTHFHAAARGLLP